MYEVFFNLFAANGPEAAHADASLAAALIDGAATTDPETAALFYRAAADAGEVAAAVQIALGFENSCETEEEYDAYLALVEASAVAEVA